MAAVARRASALAFAAPSPLPRHGGAVLAAGRSASSRFVHWRRAACAPRRPRNASAPRCNLQRPRMAQSGWAPSLLSLPKSRVLELVKPQMALSFLCSAAVTVGFSAWSGWTGETIPPLPAAPHSFMATAVSLVLVFRVCMFDA
jgi:hypothetical protein